jgi:hypothetical protein
MSFYAAVNQRRMTNGQAIFAIFQAFAAAGWLILGSGDGLLGYSGTDGSALTCAFPFAVAGNIWNTDAWFRVQSPPVNGQRREFVLQISSSYSSIQMRMKYSPNPTGATGFVGGSPSATQVPSATDEVIVYGGGTDAAPTFNTWAQWTDYQFQQHILFDQGPLGYSFIIYQVTVFGQNMSNSLVWVLDVLQQGTTQAGDPDPCVIFVQPGNFGSNLMTSNSYPKGFVGGLAPSNFVSMDLTGMNFSSGYPPFSIAGSDGNSNKMAVVTPFYALQPSSAAQPGPSTKGYSSLFMLMQGNTGGGVVVQIDPNAKGDHLNILTNDDFRILVPWPSNTPYQCG